MNKPPLHVFSGKTPVGTVARSDVEADTFLFGYRAGTAAADAVSLTMPVRADQYDSMAGLLPVFEMNLPEGALRERLRLQFAKAIPEFDDLDLLQIVGASQIGRLRYSLKEAMSADVPMQDLTEVLTYKGGADLFAHLLERFAGKAHAAGRHPHRQVVRSEGVSRARCQRIHLHTRRRGRWHRNAAHSTLGEPAVPGSGSL
jgi:serine/threonine-protein kinase HipA